MFNAFNKDREFEERIVQTKRVSKKTKGGNKIGFSALVVVGDKKGRVGAGLGKAPDVSQAIQKGIKNAKRNLITVNIKDGTIPHEIQESFKSAIVKLMPAPEGSGVIAGGAVRHVVELAGIRNISAKLIGSNNKTVNVSCTLAALSKLK
jgi:small subunit ribosomal protein S5